MNLSFADSWIDIYMDQILWRGFADKINSRVKSPNKRYVKYCVAVNVLPAWWWPISCWEFYELNAFERLYKHSVLALKLQCSHPIPTRMLWWFISHVHHFQEFSGRMSILPFKERTSWDYSGNNCMLDWHVQRVVCHSKNCTRTNSLLPLFLRKLTTKRLCNKGAKAQENVWRSLKTQHQKLS